MQAPRMRANTRMLLLPKKNVQHVYILKMYQARYKAARKEKSRKRGSERMKVQSPFVGTSIPILHAPYKMYAEISIYVYICYGIML